MCMLGMLYDVLCQVAFVTDRVLRIYRRPRNTRSRKDTALKAMHAISLRTTADLGLVEVRSMDPVLAAPFRLTTGISRIDPIGPGPCDSLRCVSL